MLFVALCSLSVLADNDLAARLDELQRRRFWNPIRDLGRIFEAAVGRAADRAEQTVPKFMKNMASDIQRDWDNLECPDSMAAFPLGTVKCLHEKMESGEELTTVEEAALDDALKAANAENDAARKAENDAFMAEYTANLADHWKPGQNPFQSMLCSFSAPGSQAYEEAGCGDERRRFGVSFSGGSAFNLNSFYGTPLQLLSEALVVVEKTGVADFVVSMTKDIEEDWNNVECPDGMAAFPLGTLKCLTEKEENGEELTEVETAAKEDALMRAIEMNEAAKAAIREEFMDNLKTWMGFGSSTFNGVCAMLAPGSEAYVQAGC